MANERVELDLVLKRLSDLEKMTKLLNDSTRSADTLIQKFATMDNRIKQLADSTKRVQVSLAEASGGRSLAQTGAMLARGRPTSFLTNAQVTGEIKDFEAQLENVVARVTNRFARGMNEVVKAAQNSEILKMAKTRQDTPLGDLRGVQAQIQAQNFRIAKEQLEMEKLVGAARDAKNVKLLKEKAALEALLPVERQLLALEKARAAGVNLQNATAGNLAKANDPAYMASVRKMSEQRIFGDSGASLFKIQGQLLVNYMLMNKVFQLFSFGTSFVLELDQAFQDLQAITDTTDTEMLGLKETLVEISSQTKFTAVDIAKAATIMGQAGFSSKQIADSIEGVALFATATGEDLPKAVDVATSTISVFNMNASEMGRVANVLTGAINLSKLTVDKLALGIQYAGNSAAMAGITLEEFVAVLGAASNTGIKAGSTLGTGLRQVITSLMNPTTRFKNELKNVGLTLADVDIHSKGIIPVLNTLNKAGFTSANAFKSMELRGAAMLIALMRSTDVMEDMQEALTLSDAAMTANERQMQGLNNIIMKFKNNLGLFINQIAGPLVEALKNVMTFFSGFFNILNMFPPLLNVLGTLFVSFLGGAILVRIGALTAGLLGLTTTINGVGIAASIASIRIGGMSAALSLLMRNPIFLATTAITAIIGLSAAFKDSAAAIDEARAAFDAANGSYNETQTRIQSVEGELNRLITRYPELSRNQRAVQNEVVTLQEKFGDFGTALDKPINTIDDLISALKDLRGELNAIALTEAELAVNKQVDVLNTQIREKMRNEYGPTGTDLLAAGVNMGPVNSSRPYPSDSKYGKFTGRSLGELGPDERKELEEILKAELRDKSRSLEARRATLGFLRDIQKFDLATRRVVEAHVRNSAFASKEFDQIKTIEQAIVTKQEELNSSKGVERQQKKAELDALGNQLLEIQANASNPENIQGIVDELGGIYSFEEISKANNSIILQETVKMLNQLGDKDREMKEDLANETMDFYDKFTELNKLKIEQLKRAMDRVAANFEAESSRIGNVISANKDPRSGGFGKYSDAEVSKMEGKQYQLETLALEARLKKTQMLLPALQELEQHQKTLMDQAQAAYAASEAAGSNDRRSEKALKSYVEAVRDYNSAENERYNLEQQINSMQGELQARVGESTEAHMSLGEAISYSIDEYVKAMEVQESFGANIKENVYGTLDAARTGFKDFVKDVATGTESVGGAFRKMANRIIEAMLDIAAQQAASGLFGLFGGIFKSIIGGFGPGGGVDMSTHASAPIDVGSISVTDINSGGYVHRYAGGGGVPGRDSINARLRPGEYVLRNSAVEMIGRSTLDSINAAGNTRASRSLGDVASVAGAANDNKETVLNVYVVAPDFKPPLTKNDVLATIQEDVYKGGQTAKLIKSIVVGKS